MDKDQLIGNMRTMASYLDESIATRRFTLLLLGLFAILALLLGAVGIYGVMAYTVNSNTRELGIRIALGAQSADVLRLVVGQGLVLTLMGVGLGLAGAFAFSRLMSTLLFGVTATDPLIFSVVPLLLVIVAVLACYIPARRATKIDPIVVLRHE
jgi:ABC-type antimicrobial peptide transport system permease subunit